MSDEILKRPRSWQTSLVQSLYRPCVGLLLFDENGNVFAGERVQQKDQWQLPQGGIDEGESPLQAARRELYEETGVQRAQILARSEGWLHYEIPSKWGKNRGQKQLWFAFRVEDKSEINVNQAHAEFQNHDFITLAEMVKRIVSFKCHVYQQVETLFAPLCVPADQLEVGAPKEVIAKTGNVVSRWG